MKISDEHVNIDGFDDQINSQQLLNQKEKFLRNYDLLRMANDNPMLRASLLLLTVVMIIFTITKICKLTYQIQYRCHRKHKGRIAVLKLGFSKPANDSKPGNDDSKDRIMTSKAG
ncbi:hypothetical protein DINM_007357 [Dirofilaria immitis]|nr:hypothetical protein [Dirofilaria immitis]